MNYAESRVKWLKANVLPLTPDGSLGLWQQEHLVLLPSFVGHDELRKVRDFIRENKPPENVSSVSVYALNMA